MTSPRHLVDPPIWDDARLEADRRQAITAFIGERAAAGDASYRERFAVNLARIETLFVDTNDLLDLAAGAAIAADPSLISHARFLAAPPISADDLDTLAESHIANRSRLDLDLARKAAVVIQAALDCERLPWLCEPRPRPPTTEERRTAIRWTAGLQTVQEIQTARRGESSRRQEATVRELLLQQGYREVPRRQIVLTSDLGRGEFCGESDVRDTKCDIPVGLRDSRLLLVECKVSNSATNSVKRLNRECGNKSGIWRTAFGDQAITAAVLAGVFKLKNLRDAQHSNGIVLFWEHDLSTLQAFLQAAG